MTERSFYDMIIVGAGISGISMAYHMKTYCPAKQFLVLERSDGIGGTWRLFSYPGTPLTNIY